MKQIMWVIIYVKHDEDIIKFFPLKTSNNID